MIPATDVSEALILALQQVVRHSRAAIVPLISTGNALIVRILVLVQQERKQSSSEVIYLQSVGVGRGCLSTLPHPRNSIVTHF